MGMLFPGTEIFIWIKNKKSFVKVSQMLMKCHNFKWDRIINYIWKFRQEKIEEAPCLTGGTQYSYYSKHSCTYVLYIQYKYIHAEYILYTQYICVLYTHIIYTLYAHKVCISYTHIHYIHIMRVYYIHICIIHIYMHIDRIYICTQYGNYAES